MDPPPTPVLPQTPSTAAAAAAAPAITTTQLSYPDSANSSPRSRGHAADTLDESSLPAIPGAKLRFMCSYGGHIVPRPNDKSLSYVGGDTRMVVVDRHSSLSDFSSRLSRTLLNGRDFTLKYQLPNEDLDSLISVTTDDDLDNMIDEYDRIASSNPASRSGRLRLFLFLGKPETAASMGSLIDDAKSETWFVDAINGSGLLPRVLSDSAADSCVELDGVVVHSDSCGDLTAQNEFLGSNHLLDSPVLLETTNPSPKILTSPSPSPAESTCLSPSMSNLPPIKVRVEDQVAGLEERFAYMTVAAAPPPPYPGVIVAGSATAVTTVGGGGFSPAVCGEHGGRVLSDDERTDQGMSSSGIGKPPLPLQTMQRKLVDGYSSSSSPDSKLAGGGFNLPSPDSVASDSSTASVTSLSKPTIYQDPTQVTTSGNGAPTDPKANNNNSDPTSRITTLQQLNHDSAYVLPPHQQIQQQFVHASTQYIHHHPATAPATNQVPISSYYHIYPPHPQMDQQNYPVYLLPAVTQTNYNPPLQSNMADSTVVASSRPVPMAPNSTIISTPSPAVYKETNVPPIYPTRIATRTTAAAKLTASTHQFHQQQQQQYMGVPPSQMHHPSQSINAANYGFEYPTHDQVYYAQPHPVPPQYQTMTQAVTTAVLLSQASAAQSPADTNTQQIRTSQPL